MILCMMHFDGCYMQRAQINISIWSADEVPYSLFQLKADARIPMKQFRRDDYAFIQELVSLYQIVSFLVVLRYRL